MLMALALVGLLLAAAGAGPPPLTNPPEIVSENGVLTGTLTVATGDVAVGKRHVETTLYDGAYMPPVLRVQPGDHVRLRLVNASTDATNLHYHGFTVTPQQGGDDPFLTVRPGESFDYDF